jgi:hypothetical protein
MENDMSNCKHCGQPFEPGERNYSGNGHFNPYTCISNLRARADAAEAANAQLRERVAELEAFLSAYRDSNGAA